MRIKEKRFSVPNCALNDGLEDKAFRLLVFLYSRTDFNGACSPGYTAMKEGASIGADSTVKYTLDSLQKKGWIFHIKKNGSSHATIWLQTPPRYRQKRAASHLIESVSF